MLSRLLSVVAIVAATVHAKPAVVHTVEGDVQGYTTDSVDVWRGIPFAQPPVGDLRFTHAVAKSAWSGVKETTSQANICPQLRLADSLFLGHEDCLYLDVYSPVNRVDPLPVLVWLFGGGYVFGDAWEFGFYDGVNLAKLKDMIIVAPNYRLGPLGFLALDELANENPDGMHGSMAVTDQRVALQWVQRNIAAFGGDPNRVTIMGESAGAFSVCYHLASPGSAGLFQNAILESGTCEAREFFVDLDDSQSWSRGFAASVGCDPNKLKSSELLPCLRKLSTGKVMGHLLGQELELPEDMQAEDFSYMNFTFTKDMQKWRYNMHELKKQLPNGTYVPLLYPIMPWGPTVDGNAKNLPDLPINLIQSGQINRANVLMGSNQNEGNIFVLLLYLSVPGMKIPPTEADLKLALDHFFNKNSSVVDSILEEYPLYEYDNSLVKAASMLLRDYFFTCSARNALTHFDKAGVSTWMYHFTYAGDWIDDLILGDYHSSELPFVFHNPWPPIIHGFSKRDEEMSNTFNTYWSNMVHFSDPNGDGRNGSVPLFWPRFNSTNNLNLVLDLPPKIEQNLVRDKCDFWSQINSLYPW